MMFGGGMLLTSVLLVIGIIFVIKFFADRDPINIFQDNKSAVQILKERYAKGEINREQFESLKKDLEGRL